MPSVQPGCKQQVYSSSSFATGNVRNQLPVLAPRSNQWTFRQIFRPILCAKVQPMDLPVSFPADSLRQGPGSGPSGNFSCRFLAPRSSRRTFRQVFQPVFCAKVQPMDLPVSFPASFLRQGPTAGPSGKFSTPFFAPRSRQWTFRQVFGPILCSKVQPMDLQANFQADSLLQGPADGPSGKFSAPFFTPRSSQWTLAKGRRPQVCSISGIYVNVSAQKEPRLLATLGASP